MINGREETDPKNTHDNKQVQIQKHLNKENLKNLDRCFKTAQEQIKFLESELEKKTNKANLIAQELRWHF